MDYISTKATLDNGNIITVYNTNTTAPRLVSTIALAGLPEVRTSRSGRLEYRFSDPTTGWFTAIGEQDTDYLDNITVQPDGMYSIVVTPFKSYSVAQARNAPKAFPRQ